MGNKASKEVMVIVSREDNSNSTPVFLPPCTQKVKVSMTSACENVKT